MKAAEIPPSGPRMKMATHASSKWYPGEPMRGRKRLRPEGGTDGSFVIRGILQKKLFAAKD